MIYFHPGFLQFGSGHLSALAPSASLAKKLNTVFVSFNYRLDALGFFPLGQFVNLTATQTASKEGALNKTSDKTNRSTIKLSNDEDKFEGNYALFDQLTAIEWVKRNIRSFGGNPRKLTVFGSDSAATILALLSYKQFRNSITKVWLAGPSVYLNKQFSLNKFLSKNRMVVASSDQQTSKLTKFNNCKTIECFQNLSAKSLILGFLDGDEPEFRINDQNDLPIQGILPNQWILVDSKLLFFLFFENLVRLN